MRTSFRALCPTTATRICAPAYEQILKTASEFAIERARPLVLFVGGQTRALERTAALIERCHISSKPCTCSSHLSSP